MMSRRKFFTGIVSAPTVVLGGCKSEQGSKPFPSTINWKDWRLYYTKCPEIYCDGRKVQNVREANRAEGFVRFFNKKRVIEEIRGIVEFVGGER